MTERRVAPAFGHDRVKSEESQSTVVVTDSSRITDGGSNSLLSSVVLPVAEEEDARTTARAARRALPENARVLAVHVVEKAGGGIDKASVEQREQIGKEAFAVVREELDEARVDTEVRYGTDVAETIFETADDAGASAIAFTPRGGSRWVQLLTGDVALDLITDTDRPIVVLPDTPE